MFAASAAMAADAAAPASAILEEVVVTATRVERQGYDAPTPTTIMSAEALRQSGKTDLADIVNTLPAFAGSVTPRSASGNISSGNAGINTLSLRGLGSNRTLVLLDGQRVVGSIITGGVDINEFPQALVSRVEVVTGGASAAYGSDALSGVANFILDRGYTGLKGLVQGGVTDYGDNESYKLSLTGGQDFAGGRGHVLLSGELADQEGVRGVPRPWFQGWQIINNPAYTPTNGQPRLTLRPNVGFSQAAPGALVTSGPLKGLVFGSGGAPRQFNYGPVVSDPMMQGGEWLETTIANQQDLVNPLHRYSLFARASYDFTENVSGYVQASYGKSEVDGQCCNQWLLGTLPVRGDNPFLPASVAAQMAAQGIPYLLVGTTLADLGKMTSHNERDVTRVVVGLEGSASLFGSEWSWRVAAQRGRSDVLQSAQALIIPNFMRAVDATRNPATGAIVCRSSLANPADGCSPFNVLGVGVNSQAAIDYINGHPFIKQRFIQDDATVLLTGEPWSTWAGPVSIALGGEHRKESVHASNDGPLSDANAYFAGNYHPTAGSYEVSEGFVEAVVPLAKDAAWARALDLDLAVREAHYSTSGAVTTWKLGMNYTPFDGVRIRATRSRDIRAPNLNDLYQAGVVNSISVSDPARGGAVTSYSNLSVGNPDLKPEVAISQGIGVVFQPTWWRNFQASIDYYDIDIDDAIRAPVPQDIVNRCFAGDQRFCAFITRNGAGVITQIRMVPANYASEVTRGLDIEAGYTTAFDDPLTGLPANLRLRALGTRIFTLETDDGVTKHEYVGEYAFHSRAVPRWRWMASATYDVGAASASLTARHVSAGVNNTSYIECASACPAATAANPTIDNNRVKGAIYVDASARYELRRGVELFGSVDNLFNKDPAVDAGALTLPFLVNGSNPAVHDTLGRSYVMGLRFEF